MGSRGAKNFNFLNVDGLRRHNNRHDIPNAFFEFYARGEVIIIFPSLSDTLSLSLPIVFGCVLLSKVQKYIFIHSLNSIFLTKHISIYLFFIAIHKSVRGRRRAAWSKLCRSLCVLWATSHAARGPPSVHMGRLATQPALRICGAFFVVSGIGSN